MAHYTPIKEKIRNGLVVGLAFAIVSTFTYIMSNKNIRYNKEIDTFSVVKVPSNAYSNNLDSTLKVDINKFNKNVNGNPLQTLNNIVENINPALTYSEDKFEFEGTQDSLYLPMSTPPPFKNPNYALTNLKVGDLNTQFNHYVAKILR